MVTKFGYNQAYWEEGCIYYSSEFNKGIQITKGDITSTFGYDCRNYDLENEIKNVEKNKLIKHLNIIESNNYEYKRFKPRNIYHYSRDVYYKKTKNSTYDKTKLFIAFKIKGDGVIFNYSCKEFLNNMGGKKGYNCPNVSDTLKLPFINLYQFDSTLSLSLEESNSLNLIRAEIDSFRVWRCD